MSSENPSSSNPDASTSTSNTETKNDVPQCPQLIQQKSMSAVAIEKFAHEADMAEIEYVFSSPFL